MIPKELMFLKQKCWMEGCQMKLYQSHPHSKILKEGRGWEGESTIFKGPRGQGGLLIWTNVGPTNQRGGLWPTIAKGPALTLVADHVCNLLWPFRSQVHRVWNIHKGHVIPKKSFKLLTIRALPIKQLVPKIFSRQFFCTPCRTV